MPPTLLPFLYQTRTLRRLCASGAGLQVLRTVSSSSKGRRQTVKRDDIPFELPDDFPVVETGPRRPRIPPSSEDRPRGTITPAEREAFDRIFQEIAARGQSGSSYSPISQVLNAEDPKDMTEEADAGTQTGELGESEEFLASYAENMTEKTLADREYGRDIINVIIQDAGQKQSSVRRTTYEPYDPSHPFEQIASAADKSHAFLKFPPSLREAAGIALGIAGQDKVSRRRTGTQKKDKQSDEDEKAKASKPPRESITLGKDPLGLLPMVKDIEAEARRRPERNRVTALIKGAKSDFQLWDIMESEVFTMVDKLGLGETKPAKKTGRKGDSAKMASGKEAKGKKLSMDVHGPLYPEFLLLGLQQMDAGFAESSTLALSILPRIKQLGLASYVLGISTSFYYRLMLIHWYRYGNAAAVLNLFEEMRHAGLSPDQNCLRVLHAASSFYAASNKGHNGNFLQQLMRMPEFEHVPYRLSHWKSSVQRSAGGQEHQVAAN